MKTEKEIIDEANKRYNSFFERDHFIRSYIPNAVAEGRNYIKDFGFNARAECMNGAFAVIRIKNDKNIK